MSNLTQKAIVATVKYYPTDIEGLLMPDGTFAVALIQVADRFQIPQKNSSRDVKALLSKDSSFLKTTTEISKTPLVILTLEQYGEVRKQLAKKGNQFAFEELIGLSGLSDVQLFSDAFGIKFDVEDRQAYLKARLEGKIVRRSLTDAIKDYCLRNDVSDTYSKFIYTNVSDCLNRKLFGKTAKQLCEYRNVDKHSLRDTHQEKDLKTIEYLEQNAMKLIDRRNVEPLEAIKQALALQLD